MNYPSTVQKQITIRLPADVILALEKKEQDTSLPVAMLVRAIVTKYHKDFLTGC